MDYREIIEPIAVSVHLDPDLVEAQIGIESAGDKWAWNPEPRYRWLWDVKRREPFRKLTPIEIVSKFPPKDFSTVYGDPDQEFWAQQASWGLMQIMGAVAREHGFIGRYLTELTDPVVNLRYGCAHLAGLFEWSRSSYAGPNDQNASMIIMRSALAAYNGGKGGNEPNTTPDRNRIYAQKVIARMLVIKDQHA